LVVVLDADDEPVAAEEAMRKLLAKAADPALARLAGEAFATITGAGIARVDDGGA